MRHSISPYPANVKVNGASQVFKDGKYLGYVDKVQNWGTDFLARPEIGQDNAFFKTKTEAVLYLIQYRKPVEVVFQDLLNGKASLSELETAQHEASNLTRQQSTTATN